MKKIVLPMLLLCFGLQAVVLEDYLPKNSRYDISIPTPKAVTGIEVGERHYRHDQIVHYLSVLAAASTQARLVDYGISNEGRRLVLLLISSATNLQDLTALQKNPNILKVYQGFSVHGNEASAANASVLYAYHLLAGRSEQMDKMLNETLIIIDATINPDGYDRFVTDVNANRGMIDNTDENDAAHQQQSPNGRTNHYWFDLNRDWLLLSQTESQARIKQFHLWQPHVLGDHHEMGSDKTFFFQPGVPQRSNPLIPKKNLRLTKILADYHAQTLSEKGMPFYSQEDYDDFYPGKGSTYPDLQGSVGILFEQASARGGELKTQQGLRSLSDGIDNQFRTALSTLNGAYAIKSQLLDYKTDFFAQAVQQAEKQNFAGYVIDLSKQHTKAIKLTDFLSLHSIQMKQLKADLKLNNHLYPAQWSYFIPLAQAQYTLIKSLFSTDSSFQDNTFYDVSAWNLAMAWGLTYDQVKQTPDTENIVFKPAQNHYHGDALAYAFQWSQGNAPAALNHLQRNNIATKIASKSFSISVNKQQIVFAPGSIIIPIEPKNRSQVLAALANLSEFFQIESYALSTGLNEIGVDLGSPSIISVQQPRVLLLFGEGINSYQAGSIWHLMDTEVGLPLTKISKNQLHTIDLHDYTHVILPTGTYFDKDDKTTEKLTGWIKQGGHLIALQEAANWAEQNIQQLPKATKDETKVEPKPYASYADDVAQNTVGGAILAATADYSHPLSFGMDQSTQYVMIKGNSLLQASKNPYATPLKANENALAAGYLADEKIKLFNNAPLVIADKYDKGSVIKFGFNPNFRGYWLGTQKWLINAIYFADLIKDTEIK